MQCHFLKMKGVRESLIVLTKATKKVTRVSVTPNVFRRSNEYESHVAI